jgi:hypothetical protein
MANASRAGGRGSNAGNGTELGGPRGRSMWGSFIANDHIDHLFRLNSIAETGGAGAGAGAGAPQPPPSSPVLRRPTFATVDESEGGAVHHMGGGSGGCGSPPPGAGAHVGSSVRLQQASRSASLEEEGGMEDPDWARANVM